MMLTTALPAAQGQVDRRIEPLSTLPRALPETRLGYGAAAVTGTITLGRGRPASINDLGQVVGTDARSGTSVAFFWSPIHGRANMAHNARPFQLNDRGQVAGERNTLTLPPSAVLWQLAVTPAETLNWYEARGAVRFYGDCTGQYPAVVADLRQHTRKLGAAMATTKLRAIF